MEDVVIGATGSERIGTDVALDTVVNADGTLAGVTPLRGPRGACFACGARRVGGAARGVGVAYGSAGPASKGDASLFGATGEIASPSPRDAAQHGPCGRRAVLRHQVRSGAAGT